MQVSSTSNNLYIQQGNGEYIHQAVRFGGADKIIEFTDRDTNRKIQFYSDTNIEKSFQRKFGTDLVDTGNLIKATGNFEKYLQDMWLYDKNELGTVDSNFDGYLDVKEMASSKRVIDIDYNETTKELTLEKFSFKDKYDTEEKALKAVEKFFEIRGITDGKNSKVSVDEDFNALFYIDSNFDTVIENMEKLADMPPEELTNQKSLTLDEKNILFSMLDEWRKKREKENDTVSSYANSINTIKTKDNIINKLLSNEADISKLSEKEKSIFLQNRKSVQNSETISMEQLVQIKEKLQVSAKYINTQADNARVFSLKI